MRILVTGGAGFIGSALANRLAQEGHEVRVIDDLSAGARERLDGRISFTRGDTRDIPKLWNVLRNVDCVYHLAARVSVPESVLYPVDYNKVNVGGTVSLLTAMRDAQVPRMVLVSSGAVYGEHHTAAVREDARLAPDTPYAVSKASSESYVRAIGKLWQLETVIMRVFNAYGPGQPLPPSHAPVVPRFVQQALHGGSVVIFGDGQQTRDFVFVDDVVQALLCAATSQQATGQVLNIGSGTGVTIADLANTIERVIGRGVHRLYNANVESGVVHLVADISRATELLDWTPAHDLESGLRAMIERDGRFA